MQAITFTLPALPQSRALGQCLTYLPQELSFRDQRNCHHRTLQWPLGQGMGGGQCTGGPGSAW